MEGFRCIEQGDLETLGQQLKGNPSFDVDKALCLACVCNNLQAVEMLLSDPRSDPNTYGGRPLTVAVHLRRMDIVSALASDPRTDPSVGDQFAIDLAICCCFAAAVRVFLDDPRVDVSDIIIPGAQGECARLLISWGIPRGRREIFEQHHPALVTEYDAIISQCHAMGFVAKQQRIWESLVEPLVDRLKASFI